MKNSTVIYRGDPLEQMSFFYDLIRKEFYLDELSMEAIKTYSKSVAENRIPALLREQIVTENREQVFFMLTGERKTTEDMKMPATFLAIENTDNTDYPYKILGAFSSRGLYLNPDTGDKVYLQMTQKKIKNFYKSNKY